MVVVDFTPTLITLVEQQAIFGTPQQRSSSDAETLQLSMDANVLAVASGGGAGKSQQANRPPHGGGLTAGFAKNESSDGYPNGNKQATDSQGVRNHTQDLVGEVHGGVDVEMTNTMMVEEVVGMVVVKVNTPRVVR